MNRTKTVVAALAALVMAAAFTGCGTPSYLEIKKRSDGSKEVTVKDGKEDKVPAKVVIPKGVTEIGRCAFWVCFSIRSVKIPGSV